MRMLEAVLVSQLYPHRPAASGPHLVLASAPVAFESVTAAPSLDLLTTGSFRLGYEEVALS